MPRILHVATTAEFVKAFLIPIAKHFRKKGWKVDAAAARLDEQCNCDNAFDSLWEIPFTRNPFDYRNLFTAKQLIRKIVQQNKYDVVHVHTPVAAFVTRLALRDIRRKTSLKIVYTAHGFHFYKGGKLLSNFLYVCLEKFAGCFTDILIVINREDKDAALAHKLVPPERLYQMPGIGVDCVRFSPESVPIADCLSLRNEIGVNNDTPLFTVVGEFTVRKRHVDALRAFAKISYTGAHLILAGDGPLLQRAKTLASNLGLENNIHFLGFRDDIPTLMRASTATLLTSDQEGLPRCAMESLSMGVLVIGSNIRGTRELLEDSCGILFPVGAIHQIADAMLWVLQNPTTAREIGACGREKMCREYNLVKILQLHEAIYAVALKKSEERVFMN